MAGGNEQQTTHSTNSMMKAAQHIRGKEEECCDKTMIDHIKLHELNFGALVSFILDPVAESQTT